MSESRDTRKTFPEVARQPGGTYWAIFDDDARKVFHVSGWSREAIEARLFNNPHSSERIRPVPIPESRRLQIQPAASTAVTKKAIRLSIFTTKD